MIILQVLLLSLGAFVAFVALRYFTRPAAWDILVPRPGNPREKTRVWIELVDADGRPLGWAPAWFSADGLRSKFLPVERSGIATSIVLHLDEWVFPAMARLEEPITFVLSEVPVFFHLEAFEITFGEGEQVGGPW